MERRRIVAGLDSNDKVDCSIGFVDVVDDVDVGVAVDAVDVVVADIVPYWRGDKP